MLVECSLADLGVQENKKHDFIFWKNRLIYSL